MKITLLSASVVAAAACLLAASAGARNPVTYVATLHSMNSNVTGSEARGEARLVVADDTLTIDIDVKGVPPNMIHWQHFHGFKDNRLATCPTEAADTDHDGIIDVVETAPMSGTTMVPFDTDPAAMDIAHGTYPKASADGAYHYHATLSLSALQAAFAKAFGDRQLDLGRRVIFIHGVPAASKLPASVASLGSIPAQVTLPIACGQIEADTED
jgi:hypothetical protein